MQLSLLNFGIEDVNSKLFRIFLLFDHDLLLPPANVVCEGYVFTPVCDSVKGGGAWLLQGRGHAWLLLGGHVWLLLGGACMVALGGHAWVLWGGVCGCSWGACMVALGGACMVAPRWGMHGCSGGACVVALGGMRGCSGGACVVAPGGHAWDTTRYGDTVNERAVRILLECILVFINVHFPGLSGRMY